MQCVNVPTRRFNACMSETDSEDAMIALEALYLGDNESTSELGHRPSLRAAALLGSTDNETLHIRIFLRLSNIYKLNGKILDAIDDAIFSENARTNLRAAR
jgi:hypothetical protein